MSKIDRKTSIGLTIGALAVSGGLLYILTRRRSKPKTSLRYSPYMPPMALAPAVTTAEPKRVAPHAERKPPRMKPKPKPKPKRPKPPTPARPDYTMPNKMYKGYYRDHNGNLRYADRGKSILNMDELPRSAIVAPVFAVEPPNREYKPALPTPTRAPMKLVPMVAPGRGVAPQRMAIASAKPRIRNSSPVLRLPERPLIKNIHATTVATSDEMLRSVRLHPVRNIQRSTSQPRISKRAAMTRSINRRAPRGFAIRPAVKPKSYRNGRAEMMRSLEPFDN